MVEVNGELGGMTMSDQVDLLVGEIAFSTSTLKRMVEQSVNDPNGSKIQIQNLEHEIQEKRRQMRVLEQRIVENGEASVANASLVDMQQTVMRLMTQCNEKSFELEIKSADNQILQEQLQNKDGCVCMSEKGKLYLSGVPGTDNNRISSDDDVSSITKASVCGLSPRDGSMFFSLRGGRPLLRMICVFVFCCLLFTLASLPVVSATTEHFVGGSSGWSSPSAVRKWLFSDIFFLVGDRLVFIYGPGEKIIEVDADGFQRCDGKNPIGVYEGGRSVIHLTEVGLRYFISGRRDRCLKNLRIDIFTNEVPRLSLPDSVVKEVPPLPDSVVEEVPPFPLPDSVVKEVPPLPLPEQTPVPIDVNNAKVVYTFPMPIYIGSRLILVAIMILIVLRMFAYL